MSNQGTAELRLLGVMSGRARYCIDMTRVRSIQPSDRVTRCDDGSADGVLETPRGPIPVYVLERLLVGHEDGCVRPGRPVVVLEGARGLWGLVVTDVSRIVTVTPDEVLPVPPIVQDPARELFLGALDFAGTLVLYLDPERAHPDAVPQPSFSALPSATCGAALVHGTALPGGILVCTTPGLISIGAWLAFSVAQTLEVIDVPNMVDVPGAPSYVNGLASWRGMVVPVLDIADRLGAEGGVVPLGCRYVVVRDELSAAVAVFPVLPNLRMLRLPLESTPVELPHDLDAELVRGLFNVPEVGLLLVPDVHAILLGSDQESVPSLEDACFDLARELAG